MVRNAARPIPHHRMAGRRKVANKRKTNWLRVALGLALVVLAVECVAVALYSPRFHVKQVTIQGTQSLPKTLVSKQVTVAPAQNIFLAPLALWDQKLQRLPGIEQATLRRVLPGRIEVAVTERQPWAAVGTRDGRWHTIDAKFVPFRTQTSPEKGLPVIVASDFAPWEALPGLPLPSPSLETARLCRNWALAYKKFPLRRIEIDTESKVLLVGAQGVQVQLGSRELLEEKLSSLERLLVERPDLLSADSSTYINLFAADAPAVGKIKPQKEPDKKS